MSTENYDAGILHLLSPVNTPEFFRCFKSLNEIINAEVTFFVYSLLPVTSTLIRRNSMAFDIGIAGDGISIVTGGQNLKME